MRSPRRARGQLIASLAALALTAAGLLGAATVAELPDPRHALACLRSHPWIPCVP